MSWTGSLVKGNRRNSRKLIEILSRPCQMHMVGKTLDTKVDSFVGSNPTLSLQLFKEG